MSAKDCCLRRIAGRPQPEGRASGYAAMRLGAVVALGGAVYVAIAGIGWLRRKRSVPAETVPTE